MMSDTHTEVPKKTILVVDDTPANLRLLTGLLTERGYTVRPAPNGALALGFVRSTPPDLILLDIKMPGMDGYEVCKQLKADERTRDIPVIFISALNEVVDKVKGFEVGGVDYITKPFQPDEVLARVKTHLTLRNLQKSLQQEIIKRKQAEEDLRELNQQLRKANASKDKFFSIIAHDLRSPFTGLIGLTGAIMETIDIYSKDKIKEKIGRLHTFSEKVYDLLTNLLAWSRLQRGIMEYEPEEISLVNIAERNVYLFASDAEQKRIMLRNQVPKGMMAYADRKMVDTVIRNLISNALKFTDADGTIEVSTRQDENSVEIAVSDTGIGMSQEGINNLFQIDVKYTRAGTAGEEGTGLGLILCKELVEKNEGTIQVESEVGKGTTFTFTLPRMPGENN